MKKLTYKTDIKTSKKLVWETMIDPIAYNSWVRPFSEGAQYVGEWKEGSHILFITPGKGGTKAVLETYKPYELMVGKHIALIKSNGEEDTDSEMAKSWLGTIETYRFSEENGYTTLTVEMETNEKFESMFSESWPKALDILKGICEK